MKNTLKSKFINELRKALKLCNMKQPKGCKKDDLIRLLNKEKKKIIAEPKKRSEIKNVFDSFGLRFDKNTDKFVPKEEKKIKTILNLEKILTPKCYICGKKYEIEYYKHKKIVK